MGPAIALFVQTAIFWWRHGSMDETAYMTYGDEDSEEVSNSRLTKGEDELSEKKHEL